MSEDAFRTGPDLADEYRNKFDLFSELTFNMTDNEKNLSTGTVIEQADYVPARIMTPNAM